MIDDSLFQTPPPRPFEDRLLEEARQVLNNIFIRRMAILICEPDYPTFQAQISGRELDIAWLPELRVWIALNQGVDRRGSEARRMHQDRLDYMRGVAQRRQKLFLTQNL